MKQRILIVVDVKQRDLPGYALLKAVLEAKHGVEVLLTPALHCRSAVFSFKPHAVVLMQLFGEAWIRFADYLHKRDILVVSLPTEGIPVLLDDDFLDYMSGRFTEKPQVDLQFCWDEEIYKRGVRFGTFTEKTAHVVGVPRFDYYHPSLAPLRESKTEFCRRYQLNPNQPIITWTSNFGGVDLTLEQHIDGAKKWKFQNLSLFQDIPKYVQNERDSRQQIANSLVRWAGKHPGHNILVRPHPNENREFYFELSRRIQVAGCTSAVPIEVPIWDVLGSTDVLVQRCCTTGVEGWLMNLPVLELRFNSQELIANPLRDAGLDLVRTYEQMEERLNAYLNGAIIPLEQQEARRAFLRQWFYKTDGERTWECAEQMVRLLRESARTPCISLIEQLTGWGIMNVRKVQRRLAKRKRSRDTYMTDADARYWAEKIRTSGVLTKRFASAKPELAGSFK